MMRAQRCHRTRRTIQDTINRSLSPRLTLLDEGTSTSPCHLPWYLKRPELNPSATLHHSSQTPGLDTPLHPAASLLRSSRSPHWRVTPPTTEDRASPCSTSPPAATRRNQTPKATPSRHGTPKKRNSPGPTRRRTRRRSAGGTIRLPSPSTAQVTRMRSRACYRSVRRLRYSYRRYSHYLGSQSGRLRAPRTA